MSQGSASDITGFQTDCPTPWDSSVESNRHASAALRREGAVVRSYCDTYRNAWDKYVYRHPRGTPFHSTSWKRTIERTFRFQSRYLLIEENGKIRGVLPLFLVTSVLFGRSLISTPFAVYGGVCADGDPWSAQLRSAACELAQKERVQYLELREPWPVSYPNFLTKELYVTFGQELPRDVDQLFRGFPRDTRYMIRKAQKHELYSVVDNGQLHAFYEVYCRSLHHLGTPAFPKQLFQALLEEFGKLCDITIVLRGKRPLAAVLSLHFRDSILPYYGGSVVEGRRFAANNFMYYELMKRALEAGMRWFDFGRSKRDSGSYLFKTQWNMPERPLPYQFFLVRRKNLPNFSPANPKFKLAIATWKSLPFGVTKMLGPMVVRAFS